MHQIWCEKFGVLYGRRFYTGSAVYVYHMLQAYTVKVSIDSHYLTEAKSIQYTPGIPFFTVWNSTADCATQHRGIQGKKYAFLAWISK